MARTAYQEGYGVGMAEAITGDYQLRLPSGPGGARFYSITPDAPGYVVRLPDATKCGLGGPVATVHNAGTGKLLVADGEGNELLEVLADQVVHAFLVAKSTISGTWILRAISGAESGSPLTIGRVPLLLTINANTLDYNARSVADAAGYDGVTPAAVRVSVGAYEVGSTSTSTPAFDSGTWPAGSTLFLELAAGSYITGKGGAGGRGGDVPPGLLAQAGGTGGPALKLRLDTVLVMHPGSAIQGGGDGGAGGAYSGTRAGGGGGGGAGFALSQGGAPGTGGGAFAGISGSTSVAGGGGDGGNAGTAGNAPGDGDAIQVAIGKTLTKIRTGTITGAETTF